MLGRRHLCVKSKEKTIEPGFKVSRGGSCGCGRERKSERLSRDSVVGVVTDTVADRTVKSRAASRMWGLPYCRNIAYVSP